ncbi:MAG: ArnT family glycosyltransferase [Prolixibacteraceae bacterium]
MLKGIQRRFLSNDDSSWLILLLLISILLRFFSFFPSELDHDESTYAIIGNEILNGKLLYTDITDTKPVGIFLAYAGWQFLFGYSIFMKRLVAAILVGVTAYFVRQVSFRLFKDAKAANAAALVYIFYSSVWSYFGLSPNTELYFNFFTITALFFLIRKGVFNFHIAGLLAGIGFMFKYLVLFDFTAFVLVFFIVDIVRLKGKFQIKHLVPFIAAGIGFLIPFALTAVYYMWKGHFDDFYFISFELPGLYKEAAFPVAFLIMLGDLLLRFFPITFFFMYALIKESQTIGKEEKWLFGVWIGMVCIAMYLPGKGFSHYTIQLMLPLSLLAGLFFHAQVHLNSWLNFIFRGKSGLIILLCVMLVVETVSFVENVLEHDSFKEVAAFLKENTNDDEMVFVANYEPIIYYLMQRETPTKYVHANLLFTDLHKAFRFDNKVEIRRIMNQHPKFVTVQYHSELMDEMMGSDYVLDRTFRDGEILVYRKKD